MNRLYYEYGTPEGDLDVGTKPMNALRKIKLSLPTERAVLTGLRETNLNVMFGQDKQDHWPQIAKDYWGGKIWKANSRPLS